MSRTIDLNADLGEECGDDGALLGIVTTASVATGAHAGGGEIMLRTMCDAAEHGVAVGAHPSYPDRSGFGRTSQAASFDEDRLAQMILLQVGAAIESAQSAGITLSHVKAHGALYHDADQVDHVGRALVAAVVRVRAECDLPDLAILGSPHGLVRQLASLSGVPFVAEGFADRGYGPDGRLLPRSHANALITDPVRAARQAVGLATARSVMCGDGSELPMVVDSLCLHGDTPGSLAIAREVRQALVACGIEIRHWQAHA